MDKRWENRPAARLKNRLSNWFFQLENEILLPFLAVGIIVLTGFGAISFYNGYTIQENSLEAMARQACRAADEDINFLAGRVPEEEIREKYRARQTEYLRITDREGLIIAGPKRAEGGERIVLSDSENALGWRLEFVVDQRAFLEEILENQRYVVIGAIAALIIIIQASIFISYNIACPIRNMGRTCHAINENRRGYRSYRFDAVKRKDEIGQLAATFELLLKNMDNYTKMEYTSRMSAALAHEIKNPIAGIRSGVQVLKGRVERDGDRMLCDSMIKEIDRVTALITNLFTLSVKRDSAMENVALEPLLREMELFYKKGLGQQGIELSVFLRGTPAVSANGNELRQILHNLIGNSIKAVGTKAGGEIWIEAEGRNGWIWKAEEPEAALAGRGARRAGGPGAARPDGRVRRAEGSEKVRAEAESRTGDGSFKEGCERDKAAWVEITVADNGCGMAEGELERALEPFYTKSVNGIGLGLAIVKKLTEQNRGFLQMESRPGRGTQVRLIFEAAKEERHEQDSDCGR